MATVHLARLVGPVGFARTVAVKQIHQHLASDAKVRSMFIDEARMAARVQHPNVVAVLDVVADERELLLVMDYVHGESLARLAPPSSDGDSGGNRGVPVPIASAILIGVLHGLHAAHEAKDEKGQPLSLVHRDVSPQNILVGLDGAPRVVDFGIAKAAGRIQTTVDGQLKGKAGYLAPEQILDAVVDRRSDVYAASVVLWELLAGRRLFDGSGPASKLRQVLNPTYEAPSRYAKGVPAEIDRLVMKGLAWEADDRFPNAWDMATALENAAPPASVRQISEWVEAIAGAALRRLAQRVAAIESASPSDVPPTRRPGESQDRIPTMIEVGEKSDENAIQKAGEAASPPLSSDVSRLDLATPAAVVLPARSRQTRRGGCARIRGALPRRIRDLRVESIAPVSRRPDLASGRHSERSALGAARRGGCDDDRRRGCVPPFGHREFGGSTAVATDVCEAPRDAARAVALRRTQLCGAVHVVAGRDQDPESRVHVTRRIPAVVAVMLLWPGASSAQSVTKDQCISAYTDAQHLREGGELLSARTRLRVCASDSCPVLLQKDCSRWLTEVEGLVPSVVLGVRDAEGRDLLEVVVALDGHVLVTRLDGRPIDVDPGEHVVRFESAGYEVIEQRVLFREGEKARSLSVTLKPVAGRAPDAPLSGAVGHGPDGGSAQRVPSEGTRPIPTATWILGGVGVLGFATAGVTGLIDLPTWNRCHSGGCAPSDKSFSDSLNIVGDVALAVGGVSLLAAAYFFITRPSIAVEPQVLPHAARLDLRIVF